MGARTTGPAYGRHSLQRQLPQGRQRHHVRLHVGARRSLKNP